MGIVSALEERPRLFVRTTLLQSCADIHIPNILRVSLEPSQSFPDCSVPPPLCTVDRSSFFSSGLLIADVVISPSGVGIA